MLRIRVIIIIILRDERKDVKNIGENGNITGKQKYR